jgi:CubicO group peptidase (beta-lactamase class C family)
LRPILAALLCFHLAGHADAEPADHWHNADPAVATWVDAVSREVQAYGRAQRPTAVMAVQGDRMILNGGRWNGTQVVPAAWAKESTTAYSQTDRIERGYGYLWWVLSSEEWGPGAFMALGYGGQIIAVIPSKRLVVVETVDLRQNAKGVRSSAFLQLVRTIAAASQG